MGQEIIASRFRKQDFTRFARALAQETALLQQWHEQGRLSGRRGIGGFELEAWLVDAEGNPAPINEEYLALLGDSALYSPELSRFNVELNSSPLALEGDALARMQRELETNWQRCRAVAQQLDADLVMIGILPTVRDTMLSLQNMSQMERYRALNEQVLRLRQGRPLELNIVGEQHLEALHGDVMLEAATTSFQLHLQVEPEKAVRYYNAMQILSAPMVAISANSPLLFGKRLWQETRIPLFEQAVAIGGIAGGAFGPLRRVSFGSGYARYSLMEVFEENAEHFPLLLPVELGDEPAQLSHLRLHNGTIWRWNRPLIGFDEDGTAHLRIEHRVIPAGPTIIDAIANAALFYGLVEALAGQSTPAEQQLEFFQARDNFYAAARYGLNAQVTWLDGRRGRMAELLQRLLPLARQGLVQLGCEPRLSEYYLSVIAQRLHSGQTGSAWQLGYLDRHGEDLAAMLAAYREGQESGKPVHAWRL
ncbi:MAG: glutamate-cysteine ligase family protein [Gammaproteobacteria bacterium]|nr:glutamate-cysteine ligase family protein [Gammaproteobacteria bacterium]MCW8840249.1 glutamate-cysteine ligase family protein [Gammaproteobacteria bacterium]MCW8959819.1 glutamate-cysteine ligase family protein [Gammaproteobacteria bacterium]MCW8971880.1 glutamate-cysteine ligase family protein [Gammaproteobacteria bacterium]MCW8994010.1 glutamate-cysteine ligase family protein [Gammaproteobacteria bacterium]